MSHKAMVVDSDFFFVEFLSGLLEKHAYSVYKAYDGKQAIAGLDEGPFDVLFADLVLPKISGRRFFEFIRKKLDGRRILLVAVSGTVIEQMDDLEAIGADYFIAKGPFEKLEIHLNGFIAAIQHPSSLPPADKKIIQTGGVFPRRDAMELLKVFKFSQEVIEALGVGVIVVDTDTRIINANEAALKVMQASIVDILNHPIMEVFPPNRSSELIAILKSSSRDPVGHPGAFGVGFNGRMFRAVVTPMRVQNSPAGWVIALEGAQGRTDQGFADSSSSSTSKVFNLG
jgi:CheY-like chemotaxis protein